MLWVLQYYLTFHFYFFHTESTPCYINLYLCKYILINNNIIDFTLLLVFSHFSNSTITVAVTEFSLIKIKIGLIWFHNNLNTEAITNLIKQHSFLSFQNWANIFHIKRERTNIEELVNNKILIHLNLLISKFFDAIVSAERHGLEDIEKCFWSTELKK